MLALAFSLKLFYVQPHRAASMAAHSLSCLLSADICNSTAKAAVFYWNGEIERGFLKCIQKSLMISLTLCSHLFTRSWKFEGLKWTCYLWKKTHSTERKYTFLLTVKFLLFLPVLESPCVTSNDTIALNVTPLNSTDQPIFLFLSLQVFINASICYLLL